jgi:PEP-CTERM motif
METGSTNYNFFDTPTFAGGSGFGVGVGLQISAVATPEPSTWVMMGLGFASLGFAGWRAQRETDARAA